MSSQPTPRSLGYRQPAEWAAHRAIWLAWPSHPDLWTDHLSEVRASFVALCRAVAAADEVAPDALPASAVAGPEVLEVLVPDEASERAAAEALAGVPVRFSRIPFGDIWLRDTAPVFVRGPGGVAAVQFAFNGWGGKYVLEHDDGVAARIAERAGMRVFTFDGVLEGGSVDTDGEGTLLTTRQCLLNPNRNPNLDARALEVMLGEALGAERVLWLGEGLKNDHTDGHVDTLARFVRPGVVLTMRPSEGDPNREVLDAIAGDLSTMVDASGRRLEVLRIPSPGLIEDEEGAPMPASYVNFVLGNRAVVVPTYGSPHDHEAVEQIGMLFPDRRVVGVPAKAVLAGGGAFHCITQQEPALEVTS